MLFTFAGSGHTNYTSYTLEMICDLEFKSSPELKEALLLSLVVNPTGEEGGFVAGDIYQEGLNRGIEPIVQKKDANFGAYHIRHLWSRNIKDIQDLRSTFRTGVGLSKRSGRHKDPHKKPEFKTLLHEYKKAELHVRRPGRVINGKRTDGENVAKGRDVDNMQKGIRALANGGLKKWIGKTTRARGLREDTSNSALESGPNHGDSNNTEMDDDMWLCRDRDEDTSFDGHMTFGVMHAKGGEFVVEYEGDEDNIEDEMDGTAEISDVAN
jgi:hypothetical protein